MNMITRFLQILDKQLLFLHILPWSPQESYLLVRGCFRQTGAPSKILLMINMSICKIKWKAISLKVKGRKQAWKRWSQRDKVFHSVIVIGRTASALDVKVHTTNHRHNFLYPNVFSVRYCSTGQRVIPLSSAPTSSHQVCFGFFICIKYLNKL